MVRLIRLAQCRQAHHKAPFILSLSKDIQRRKITDAGGFYVMNSAFQNKDVCFLRIYLYGHNAIFDTDQLKFLPIYLDYGSRP